MDGLKGWYRVVWDEGRHTHSVQGEYVRTDGKFLIFKLPSSALICLNAESVIKIEELAEAGQ